MFSTKVPNQGNTRRLQQLSTFKMTRVIRRKKSCRWTHWHIGYVGRPPPSNSDHQVCYIFSRAFLETFIYHCYWEGIATRRCQPNSNAISVISNKASSHVTTSLRPRKSCISVEKTLRTWLSHSKVCISHTRIDQERYGHRKNLTSPSLAQCRNL